MKGNWWMPSVKSAKAFEQTTESVAVRANNAIVDMVRQKICWAVLPAIYLKVMQFTV
ncbi:hypothetical protein ACNKHW_05860 [Shigella flexneri]